MASLEEPFPGEVERSKERQVSSPMRRSLPQGLDDEVDATDPEVARRRQGGKDLGP